MGVYLILALLLGTGDVMAARDWLHPVKHLRAMFTSDHATDFLNPGRSAPIPQPPQAGQGVRPRAANEPDTDVYGASGTPVISGFVTDLQEYNSEMRGRNALPVYEKMRRSDADVAALLLACKLPIRSAEFKVMPGAKENEPDYERCKEEAAFVENCLFGDLEYSNSNGVKFSQRFESVIENALLCLDFGCSGSEDLWTIDADRIRLSRIAPRLPLTFYRFHVDDDGEVLKAVEQWGYRGNQWVTVTVPASKFTLFSFRQEGANFYGRAMLREAYQHWYIKSALYRIDSIACERNGAGIPVITLGPSPAVEDKLTCNEWVQDIAAHEMQGLVIPNGYTFQLVGVTGSEHKLDPSISHHSEMICRSGLAMFMSLGATQTGSRALGNTFVDFFQLAEAATGRFICSTISETTIRRLIDYNYPRPEGRPIPYPQLVIPHIAVVNPLDLLGAIKDISNSAVDMLQPDDDTENWIRKQVGMPSKSGQVRPRYGPVATRVTETSTESPEQIEQNNPGDIGEPTVPAATKPAVGPLAKGAQPKPAPAKLTEIAPTRALRPDEQHHDFTGHAKRQDSTQTAVRRILAGAKPALIRQAAQRMAPLEPKSLDSVALRFDKALCARVSKSLEIAHGYGTKQVYAERQKATKRPASQKALLSAEPITSASQDKPYLIAETAVSDMNNWITSRARGAHVDGYKQGLRDVALEQYIVSDLQDGSDSMLDRIGAEAARSAVGGGRFAAFEELQGEIGSYVRSEAMDVNTCEECASGDGDEWSSLDDVTWSPGDDCSGADQCRGQLMPIFSDENTIETE